MSNQWGRNGNGSQTGSGIGGILFASILCLALGTGAGYGTFRLMGSAPQGEIEARDKRITDLARELDKRIGQLDESTRQAEALSTENGALKREIETLRKGADAPDPDMIALAAEHRKLAQEIVPKLENDLQLLGQRAADAEALQERAEEAVKDRERQLSLQADRIASLQQTCTRQDAETGGLKAEVATLAANLERARQAESALRTRDVPALKEEIARKDREIAALGTRTRALAEQMETLRATSCAAQPNQAEEDTPPARSTSPRDTARVAQAMRQTPGLDALTSVQRDQLERSLASGECVTNALGGVFRRIPVLALRNLMRDLDADC